MNTEAAPGKNMLTKWVIRSQKVSNKAIVNYQLNRNQVGVPPPRTEKTRSKQRELQLGARQLVRLLADQAIERSEKSSTSNTEPTTKEKTRQAASFYSIFSKKFQPPIENQQFLKIRRKVNPSKLTKCEGRSSQNKVTHLGECGVGPNIKRKRERSPNKQIKRTKSKSKSKFGDKIHLITEFFNGVGGREEGFIKSSSSTGRCPFS